MSAGSYLLELLLVVLEDLVVLLADVPDFGLVLEVSESPREGLTRCASHSESCAFLVA